jgi:hypothetical protein
MEKMKVRELMTPISRFPRIADTAPFYEALQALEAAQENYLSGKSPQRILLVEDAGGNIVGKLSPIDLIRGLEPKYDDVEMEKTSARFGVGYVRKSMQDEYRLWKTPFQDLCRKAADVRIKDFVRSAEERQSINIDDPLARAFDCFVMGRHDSLFIVENKKIVGLLRFSDVYNKMAEIMRACGL